MNEQIRTLEPNKLWNFFCDLNAVPRPSKKEERVIAFIKSFGESLNLPTLVDEAGNVIIKKPATAELKDRATVVLQSHLDMVHQKNADTEFDFPTQGIEMFVDGDWVKAKGTTLGADNGIGVAAIMTLLASDNIPHPPLEALFTIDEETGMTGALALKGGLLDGTIMLNLDTEEDNELTIGCAGGIDVTATGEYQSTKPINSEVYTIILKGLTGGHSGIDIHKGRGNANKLMNRLLWTLNRQLKLEIISVEGGSLRNAIPRESFAVVVIDKNEENIFLQIIAQHAAIFKQEYQTTDAGLILSADKKGELSDALDKNFQIKILNAVYSAHHGIYRMSPDIASLVQTSNNVSRIEVHNGKYSVQCLTRSSVNTEKTDLANALVSSFEQIGASIAFGGDYPGWVPRPESDIVKLMSTLYKEMFQEEAHVSACHAGLECGILGRNYPDMQMISFGPNIYGAHSPDEKVQISSVQKFWLFLLETLKRIPVRA